MRPEEQQATLPRGERVVAGVAREATRGQFTTRLAGVLAYADPDAGGTLADHLARTQPADSFYGRRLVASFLRQGVDRHGLWFDYTMSLPVGELTAEELRFIAVVWHKFCNGQDPFGRRRDRRRL